VGFYADPPHFQDYVDRWMAEFGPRLRVRATQQRPIEWWTNRPKAMVDALERFHSAVTAQQLSHDGGTVLTRHVLNARRRIGRTGLTISKEYPGSPRKIDAAMAAVLAYECRADAVTAGFARPRRKRRAYGF
jgi:phage terminase large subunit-like protein